MSVNGVSLHLRTDDFLVFLRHADSESRPVAHVMGDYLATLAGFLANRRQPGSAAASAVNAQPSAPSVNPPHHASARQDRWDHEASQISAYEFYDAHVPGSVDAQLALD